MVCRPPAKAQLWGGGATGQWHRYFQAATPKSSPTKATISAKVVDARHAERGELAENAFRLNFVAVVKNDAIPPLGILHHLELKIGSMGYICGGNDSELSLPNLPSYYLLP